MFLVRIKNDKSTIYVYIYYSINKIAQKDKKKKHIL